MDLFALRETLQRNHRRMFMLHLHECHLLSTGCFTRPSLSLTRGSRWTDRMSLKDTASQAPQVAALTLADVLARVLASEALSPGKKGRDRLVGPDHRPHGRPAARAHPGRPDTLRQRLKQLMPRTEAFRRAASPT